MDIIKEFRIKAKDFINAGEGSMEIRNALKLAGVDPDLVHRVSICAYEAEMNVVMHGGDGIISMMLNDTSVVVEVMDDGQGIADINLALTEGYTTAGVEVQQMGFGAGMGLPNIVRNSDFFRIFSEKDKGAYLKMCFWIKPAPEKDCPDRLFHNWNNHKEHGVSQ
jgi:serine/threonine-protein kinase RsbT